MVDSIAISSLVQFAMDNLAKGVLVLGTAAIVTWLVRYRSAALRHAAWGCALLVLVSMPILTLIVPAWHVSFIHLPFPAPAERVTVYAPQDERAGANAMTDTGEATEAPLLVDRSSGATVKSHRGRFLEVIRLQRIVLVFVVVWLLGIAVLFGRLLLRYRWVWKLGKGAVTPSGAWMGRIRSQLADSGIRRPVRIRIAEGIPGPLNWGIFRPVIYLPPEAERWKADRVRIVLNHELAHIRRFDYVFHLAGQIVCALHWPNPLAWYARERLYVEQERACDDELLRDGTRPYRYAEHLLAIAQAADGRRQFPRYVGMADVHGLRERIVDILDDGRNRRPVSPTVRSAIGVATAAVALSVSAFSPWEDDVDPSQSTNYLWFEAESGVVSAPMRVNTDELASNGHFVWVADGPGNDDGGDGTVRFEFELENAGTYVLWGRGIGPYTNDNSFYASVDDGSRHVWNMPGPKETDVTDTWTWSRLPHSGVDAGPLLLNLDAGRHTITIQNREDGTRLDALLLTDDLSGSSDEVSRAFERLRSDGRSAADGTDFVWMEAEDAEIDRPLGRFDDRDDASAGFVGSMQSFEAGADADPNSLPKLRVNVTTRSKQPLILWTRVHAGDELSTIWVRVDGGRWIRRGGIRHGRAWKWQRLRDSDRGTHVDLDLAPGEHLLEIAHGGRGILIDRILLTTDPSYVPSGTGSRRSSSDVLRN